MLVLAGRSVSAAVGIRNLAARDRESAPGTGDRAPVENPEARVAGVLGRFCWPHYAIRELMTEAADTEADTADLDADQLLFTNPKHQAPPGRKTRRDFPRNIQLGEI